MPARDSIRIKRIVAAKRNPLSPKTNKEAKPFNPYSCIKSIWHSGIFRTQIARIKQIKLYDNYMGSQSYNTAAILRTLSNRFMKELSFFIFCIL